MLWLQAWLLWLQGRVSTAGELSVISSSGLVRLGDGHVHP